jgi:hypothetical protein
MPKRIITDKEIEDGLAMLACLIDWYGDVYWPLFERLEAELQQRQSRAARLRARLPVNDNDNAVKPFRSKRSK